MKQLILTIIYPFWFFFAQTWLGNVMLIPFPFVALPFVLGELTPILDGLTQEDCTARLIIISIITFLPVTFLMMFISDNLEIQYKKMEYPVQINDKYSL